MRCLTKKNAKFEWNKKQDDAFKVLCTALTTAPVLSYFDTENNSYIYVDASPVGLGAILVQEEGSKKSTVAYASRSLTEVEQRYSQTEREALAVIWACEHFHIYIYGKPVTVVTDHKPLTHIFNNPNSKPNVGLCACNHMMQ